MENLEIDEVGTKRWRNEEGFHRLDGPAVEYSNGDKSWYVNGKLHRLDGPAVELNDGNKYWHIEGKEYSEEEYNKKISEMNSITKKENPEIDEKGNKRWYNEKGEFHRIDGPAIEYANGNKYWYINGKRHRLDGPAREIYNGNKYWWIEGKEYTEKEYNKKISEINLTKRENPEIDEDGNKIWKNEKGEKHRLDGPAFENSNGYKAWYKDDKRHRIDGPAIEYVNGSKEWYINGKLHREDGPAVEDINGDRRWFIEGKEYSEEEYNKKISEMNSINKKENPEIDEKGNKRWYNEKGEFHRIDGPAIEWYDGTKEWYINGKCHREDGPAFESINGRKEWYINGKCHREDGPAVEYFNGSKYWYINGKLHRIDGPAIENYNGYKRWYIEGKEYSEEEYNKKVLEINLTKKENPEIDEDGNKRWKNEKGEYHRLDGPAFEFSDGSKKWWINGKYHREDGPAIENINGDKFWYINGKLHREDGPAVEWYNGYKAWYIEGKIYSEEEYNKKISEMNITKKENPAIDEDGDKFWYNEKGELHRIDGPAIEHILGRKAWWINGISKKEIITDRFEINEYNKKISEINLTKETNNKTTKEEKTMKDIIKDRFEKAAYRTAGRQMTSGVVKAITKIAEKKGMDSFTISAIGSFFETEIGEAFIGMLLGVGLPYIPKLNQDKRVQRLAEEFQIESASRVADVVLEEAMQYFLPVVGEILQSLPEENKRVEEEDEEDHAVVHRVTSAGR